MIDEKDFANLISNCGENLLDRAFIDIHYEAGTRPGEILSLKIKHVKFDQYGAVIHVDGKTGPRPIRLVKSTLVLQHGMMHILTRVILKHLYGF